MTLTGREAIVLDRVTAGYDRERPVLREWSFTVPDQGMIRLAGGNGTGKSTLIEVISGYLRPWSGGVSVVGRQAHSREARQRRRIVRTAPALFDHLTVRDHLTLFSTAYGIEVHKQLHRADALGLGPWLDEQAGTLSSGTAKKLWYVMCTGGQAGLVVLDEPFNAVDADGTAVMVAELSEWARSAAVVVVCHTRPAGLSFDTVVALDGAGPTR